MPDVCATSCPSMHCLARTARRSNITNYEFTSFPTPGTPSYLPFLSVMYLQIAKKRINWRIRTSFVNRASCTIPTALILEKLSRANQMKFDVWWVELVLVQNGDATESMIVAFGKTKSTAKVLFSKKRRIFTRCCEYFPKETLLIYSLLK